MIPPDVEYQKLKHLFSITGQKQWCRSLELVCPLWFIPRLCICIIELLIKKSFPISICPVSSFGIELGCCFYWCILYFLPWSWVFIAAWRFCVEPGWISESLAFLCRFCNRCHQLLLFKKRFLPHEIQSQIHSGSSPDKTRLFTLFISACMCFLMLNDAILTDAKWPDLRLCVHWEIQSDGKWSVVWRLICTDPGPHGFWSWMDISGKEIIQLHEEHWIYEIIDWYTVWDSLDTGKTRSDDSVQTM